MPQSDLAKQMASADVFVFPSESEIVSNVVIEAKASGLPVIVTDGATTGQLVSSPGVDGLLTDDPSIDAYAEAIEHLLIAPDRRRRMGRDARIAIERSWPDWTNVLAEDLLPVWKDVKARFSDEWWNAGHPIEQLPAAGKHPSPATTTCTVPKTSTSKSASRPSPLDG